ncbi:pentapeptide repeat-containing protein [Paractinoplanes toevensis]
MAHFAGAEMSTARFVGCNLYGATFDEAMCRSRKRSERGWRTG